MKTTALADRYIRSEDYASRIDGVQLAPEVWAVFAQLHRARTTAELAATLKLDLKAVQSAVRSLSRRKLVQKHVLDWRAYSAACATPEHAPEPDVRNTNIAPPPAAIVEQHPRPAPAPAVAPASASASVSVPGAPTTTLVSPVISVSVSPPPAPTAPPQPTAPTIRFRLASERLATPAPKPAISFRLDTPGAIVASPPAATPSSARWRLRPVLDAIGAKAGGGLAGQLLVYRVFLHVPTDLMRAGGLHSLNLVDDHFVAHHAPLRAAIVKAARAQAQVDVEPLLAG